MAPSSRAKLQADLAVAAEKDIPNIRNIHKRDDGFVFTFYHSVLQSPHQVEIHVTPQDETFLVYTDASNIPASVASVLEASIEKSYGLKVPAMLDDLSRRLRAALEGSSADDEDTVMTDVDDSDFGADDYDDVDDSDADAEFEYGEDDDVFGIPDGNVPGAAHTPKPIPSAVLCRIRRDFRATRKAGFKVGIISGFHQYADHSIASISIRVDKLCLSDETREAWNLDSSEFIVLLIRFNDSRYTTIENAIDLPAARSNLEFRLRKCSRYKPTLRQAMSTFSSETPKNRTGSVSTSEEGCEEGGLAHLGIGGSIDMFMDKDFVSMLKLRMRHNLSWDTAKKYLSIMEKAATPLSSESIVPLSTIHEESSSPSDKLPHFLSKDEDDDDSRLSLPLIATKFALRYFVRCADYCMICHQKVEGNFEALKPYICGDSLCLFQYMSLGFGPSIDNEIINQPRVVDLLISFCYASLASFATGRPKLREFPTGLSLPVPNIRPRPLSAPTTMASSRMGEVTSTDGMILIDPMKVNFNWDTSTATLDSADHAEGLREGQWVVISTPYITDGSSADLGLNNGEIRSSILHYARIHMISGRVISLGVAVRHPMPCHRQINEEAIKGTNRSPNGEMVLCNQNLDDLDQGQKAFAMSVLLAALPSVPDMRAYLTTNPGRQLSTWDRMVPGSMGLLRWIVASNRSYIVQIDGGTDDDGPLDDKTASREDERIYGVDNWMQFRFAQGSPEKEALFQEALGEVKKPQRSLLAWHGSSIGNWHSIIRQGLDYAITEHGRAYGNGVYFSREFNTSMSYCTMQGNGHPASWPKSTLKMDAAIGLAELVNRPGEFQSHTPYFVVQHCHWIQCRYLFVRCSSAYPSINMEIPPRPKESTVRGDEFIQDPKYVTRGPGQKQLFVPKIAIPSASQNVKHLPNVSFKHDAEGHTGDSGDEDEEDIKFLLSDDDEQATPAAGSRSSTPKLGVIGNLPPSPAQLEPRTDFQPGTLDLNTLPRLKPPTYATDLAQKMIGRELKKLQKVQSSTPMQELGWYIDFDNINNMFQWIVELHSFDLSLPLGQDMKKVGTNSVVLEIRFGRDFPMSPPFVRVIRPRFLPFLEGGGGHVTAGGAMCMELLTTTGWSPANSLEAVLVQVRLALCSMEPRPARLQSAASRRGAPDYGVGEAFDAYARAAHTHGWQVPKDQLEMRSSR